MISQPFCNISFEVRCALSQKATFLSFYGKTMNEITKKRFRPVLVTIFWCLFFFRGIAVGPDDGALSGIIFAGFLAVMLLFKVEERIGVDDDNLYLKLDRAEINIARSEITGVSFLKSIGEVEIRTKNSSLKYKISHFDKEKVEDLFMESGLCQSENN